MKKTSQIFSAKFFCGSQCQLSYEFGPRLKKSGHPWSIMNCAQVRMSLIGSVLPNNDCNVRGKILTSYPDRIIINGSLRCHFSDTYKLEVMGLEAQMLSEAIKDPIAEPKFLIEWHRHRSTNAFDPPKPWSRQSRMPENNKTQVWNRRVKKNWCQNFIWEALHDNLATVLNKMQRLFHVRGHSNHTWHLGGDQSVTSTFVLFLKYNFNAFWSKKK